jgi:hypothetical protein
MSRDVSLHQPPDCTCYLGDPVDPTRDEEACAACDAEFWRDPVFIYLGGDHP